MAALATAATAPSCSQRQAGGRARPVGEAQPPQPPPAGDSDGPSRRAPAPPPPPPRCSLGKRLQNPNPSPAAGPAPRGHGQGGGGRGTRGGRRMRARRARGGAPPGKQAWPRVWGGRGGKGQGFGEGYFGSAEGLGREGGSASEHVKSARPRLSQAGSEDVAGLADRSGPAAVGRLVVEERHGDRCLKSA